MSAEAKRRAAREALAFLEGAGAVGVGTGSTVMELVAMLEPGGDRIYVPSSWETAYALARRGLRVLAPQSVERLDVYVDGADEVDGGLNMIKGRGAALAMEKVLARYSGRRIFVVDSSKLVSRLGEKGPLPLEVLPEAASMVRRELESMGLNPRFRSCEGKRGPVVSDTRGIIIDVDVPRGSDLEDLERSLRSLPGVVETGLFLGMADAVIVGYEDRVRMLTAGRA